LPDLSSVFRVLIINRWKHDYVRVLSRDIRIGCVPGNVFTLIDRVLRAHVMCSMIGKISRRPLILIKFRDLSSTRQNLTRKCSHLHNTALYRSIQEYYLEPGICYPPSR